MATMKAVNYHGPFQVKVQEIEKPKIEHPDDVIVKVTTVSFPSRQAMSGHVEANTIFSRPSAAPTFSELNARKTKDQKCLQESSMYEGRTAAEAGITFGRRSNEAMIRNYSVY
jgi:hypothetical protein